MQSLAAAAALLWLLLSSSAFGAAVSSSGSESGAACHPHFVYDASPAESQCHVPPEKWSSLSDWCQDLPVNRPSPIELPLSNCSRDGRLAAIRLSSSWSDKRKFSVKNNGHSVQADALSSDLTVSGGSLNGMYTAVQFHFHWGSAANMAKGVGSEHVMFDKDGRRVATPAEVHIVCRRSDLSFSEAAATADGIAVLGAFIGSDGKSSNKADRALRKVIGNVAAVATPKSKGRRVNLRLRNLLPSIDQFVNYDGAFTTPKCNPVVQWHIFTEVVSVKAKLLKKLTKTFFDAEGKEPMADNFRPVMQRHGRVLRCR